MSERVRAAITVGFGGGPGLMCADCEDMIDDFVLGQTLEYLETIAQGHRCDEGGADSAHLGETEYEKNWRKGKDGQ